MSAEYVWNQCLSFIEANLWDEAYVFKAVKELQSGIKAPLAFQFKEIGSSKGDRVLHALNSFV